MAKSSSLSALLLALVTSVTVPPTLCSPHSVGYSKILGRAADVKSEYDYIVVGGGTAGLTVADRLTEDGKCKSAATWVLKSDPDITAKQLRFSLSNSAYSVGYTSSFSRPRIKPDS
jgi:hypothetical protein